MWVSVFIVTMFYSNSVINANRVEPNQTPRSAASDMGLHCLPVSILGDARHKWINSKQHQEESGPGWFKCLT